MKLGKWCMASAVLLVIGCGADSKKNNSGGAPPDDPPANDIQSDKPKQPAPSSGPSKPRTPAPAPSDPKPPQTAEPSPYGQTVDATLTSIQTKLIDPYCVACHSGANAPNGLDLTDLSVYAAGTLGAGGYRGIFVYPGRPEISAFKLVLQDHAGEQVMPPSGNLLGIPAVLPQQIQAVTDWIRSLEGTGGGPIIPGER